jgi:GNAT superfamily N-acetyltransferase
MTTIAILPPPHLLVEAALAQVEQVSPVAWVILFGGDRWYPVEYVALAVEQESPVGIATLAPADELDKNGPQIIGIWVHPVQRRRRIATALLTALAEQSLSVYGKQATWVVATREGSLLAASLAGVPLVIRDASIGTSLPDKESWLSLDEASARYPVKRDTLYDACAGQRCPAKRLGRSYIVNEYDPNFQMYIRGTGKGRPRGR